MKRWIIGLGAAMAVLCGAMVIVLVTRDSWVDVARENFEFSPEVYEESGFQELTASEFEQMVDEKKSFLVILRMAVCPAEFPITDVAKQLAREDGLTVYGLTEEEFKKTDLTKVVKYLPSAALYREGELVDYLDAEKDEDMKYYKSVEGLKEWIGV